MEKKRKRIQSSDHKEAALVSSSTEQNAVKMASGQQQKDKELNYRNKPPLLFNK